MRIQGQCSLLRCVARRKELIYFFFSLLTVLFNCRVRIWDIIILVPNVLFMIFLAIRFNRARLKLRATNSPIFMTVYCLVIGNVVISVIRCIVSMTVNAATSFGSTSDKILWVTVRFFLLSTEMSVVIFGLACGEFYLYFIL